MSYHHEYDPVAILLSIPLGMLIGGIFLALAYIQFEPCGQGYIYANDQVYCIIPPNTSAKSLSVSFDENVIPAGVTTYVFSKAPKTYPYDKVFPVHQMVNTYFSTMNCSSVLDSTVKFHLYADRNVDVQYIGTIDEKQPDTLVYEKNNVKDLETSFMIKALYQYQRFVISSTEPFTGNLSVTVTSPRYDVSSVKYEKKCKDYPCEWDLSDAALKDKKLYMITENTGDVNFDIHAGEKAPHIGYLVGGIILSCWSCTHSH